MGTSETTCIQVLLGFALEMEMSQEKSFPVG